MEHDESCGPVLLPEEFINSLLSVYDCASSTDAFTNWVQIEPQLLHFISSNTPQAVYVFKSNDGERYISFDSQDFLSESFSSVIVLLKPAHPLTTDTPVLTQINAIRLVLTNKSLASIRNFLSNVVSPYFETLSLPQSHVSNSFAQAKQKLRDLDLSLLHLNSHITAPDLLLEIPTHLRSSLTSGEADPETLGDTSYLNDLTSLVNRWIRQIQSVTSLVESQLNGKNSVQDEINFWIFMQQALESIAAQISQPEIKNAIFILSNAKRFQTTLLFQDNLGISEKLYASNSLNSLFKDLPVSDLRSSINDIDHFVEKVSLLFTHLRHWKPSAEVQIPKIVDIVELIIKEIGLSFINTLEASNLLTLLESQFELTRKSVLAPFYAMIDSNIKHWTNYLREVVRKRQEKFMMIRINQSSIESIFQQLDHLAEIKLKHHDMISKLNVFPNQDQYIDELIVSFNKYIVDSSPYDTSKQGMLLFSMGELKYLKTHSSILVHVRSLMNRSLTNCVAVNDFHSLFAKLCSDNNSSLEVLIDDSHRLRLLEAVHKDLQDLFKITSNFSTASGSLEKVDHITSRLSFKKMKITKIKFYLYCLDSYLGKSWLHFALGAKIKEECLSTIESENPNNLLASWIDESRKYFLSYNFKKLVLLSSNNHIFVSVDTHLTALGKQKNEILDLGFSIPTDLLNQFEAHEYIEPLAISLVEHISLLERAIFDSSSRCSEGQPLESLLQTRMVSISRILKILSEADWGLLLADYEIKKAGMEESGSSSPTTLLYLSQLESEIFQLFQLKNQIDQFDSELQSNYLLQLKNSPFNIESISSVLRMLISASEQLVRKALFDNSKFEDYIQHEIRQAIEEKFCSFVELIIKEIEGEKLMHQPLLRPTSHKILHENGDFIVYPPIYTTRSEWTQAIQEKLQILDEVLLTMSTGISVKVVNNESVFIQTKIGEALQKIDKAFWECEKFCQNWSIIKELSASDLSVWVSQLGSDINKWLASIKSMTHAKHVLESPDGTWHYHGCIEVLFRDIQTKTMTLFKAKENGIIEVFKSVVQNGCTSLVKEIKKCEAISLASINLQLDSELVLSKIECLYETKFRLEKCEMDRTNITEAYKLLRELNAFYGVNWVDVKILELRLKLTKTALDEISNFLTEEKELVFVKVKEESTRIKQRFGNLSKDWFSQKPVAGDTDPLVALATMTNFEKRFLDIQRKQSFLLNFSREMGIVIEEKQLIMPENLQESKNAWLAIQTLHEELERVLEQSWEKFHPRNLKSLLEELLRTSRSQELSVKQNGAIKHFQAVINNLVGQIPLLSDLKRDAIKERHWKQIFIISDQENSDLSSLKLLDVFNLNLMINEGAVKSIIDQAQNEEVIEVALNNIKSTWSKLVFQTFEFHGKCRLIRNWATLFDQCNDDINTLSSMKNSSYFGEFEKVRSDLEEQLSTLSDILNLWVDVQRRWAYLDGVFDKNQEIHSSLPVEASRFENISFEFTNLLNKVGSITLVIDVLSIRGLLETLQKIDNGLEKTKRGLTEFLEKQRSSFPRLYFMGNEDLLELIGGQKDQGRINKHIELMFFGVERLHFDDTGYKITAVESPEHEVLQLSQPISLLKHQELTVWLREFEEELKRTIFLSINTASHATEILLNGHYDKYSILEWINGTPFQALIVAIQLLFTKTLDSCTSKDNFAEKVNFCQRLIENVAALSTICENQLQLRKMENLIIELIHQRNVLNMMKDADIGDQVKMKNQQQLFYFNPDAENFLNSLLVIQGRSKAQYGFEYHGVFERLVRTPLLEKCFLAMSNALSRHYGGSPFGPAGTGKTESIKALGYSLGMSVKVFNCDDSFDFASMGRIFLGVCKVGCWGCFDEFNRLQPNILSSLSYQVELIQGALRGDHQRISIGGIETEISPETGIFITMNPDYVGRNELPENLKNLFRSFPMKHPDLQIIVEVILTSKLFKYANRLALQIVPFFLELSSRCSKQKHYDFGLRALKGILRMCRLQAKEQSATFEDEVLLILKGLQMSILPKLVEKDKTEFDSLKRKYFELLNYEGTDDLEFADVFSRISSDQNLHLSESFVEKACQVLRILSNHHGFMLVGKSCSAKTTIFNNTIQAMSEMDNIKNEVYRIDSKVLNKESLFGALDPVTRDWSDGLFTRILRGTQGSMKGELNKRIWIVFDGDIDPEWAENLNSVLDDNKLLTLPNGERLPLYDNTKIVFEVDNLDYTTPATTSRCGVVWFDENIVSPFWSWQRFIASLQTQDKAMLDISDTMFYLEKQRPIQKRIASITGGILQEGHFCSISSRSATYNHIMDFDVFRIQSSFQTYFISEIKRLLLFLYKEKNFDTDELEQFVLKSLCICLLRAFAGDCSQEEQENFSIFLSNEIEPFMQLEVPENLSEVFVSLPGFRWTSWMLQVEPSELEPHQVMDPGLIVPTVDTVILESIINAALSTHLPLVLCGPPGSGKTMTLMKSLRQLPTLDVISLNFSKDTTPGSLLALLEQHCEYSKSSKGLVLSPKIEGKWVVVFCDEINLPAADSYGTQKVISLIRQIVENNGFWRPRDKQWVHCSNIQFVGACNDPKDPGRQRLPDRFMRHVCLIQVGYPGKKSLKQIYQSFNRAILKCAPDLRGFAEPLTDSMLLVYHNSKEEFTPSKMSHYVYSPRELTRWCRGILETVIGVNYSKVQQLIRLWFHEGLRIFSDRLVEDEERKWTRKIFHDAVLTFFPHTSLEGALVEPVLFSTWLSSEYEPVSLDELKRFVGERLKVFSEEETNVELILHEDMLDHILRIDRVLRQRQGHMILVGPSTSGKSTMAKFVAWTNGIRTVQLRVHSGYSIDDFDETLRDLLIRCVKGEKICFLVDESSILATSFIERMNTLLANSEVPGLFEGESLEVLFRLCASEAASQGLLLDNESELYDWFVKQVAIHLHVIFTVSGTLSETGNEIRPQVHSSPALFNRCVLSWMGDWTDKAFFEVGQRIVQQTPLDKSGSNLVDANAPIVSQMHALSYRDVVVNAFVKIHRSVCQYPNKYIEFVKQFVQVFLKTQSELEANQRTINNGLDKLRETVLEVQSMRETLAEKNKILTAKDVDARRMLDKMIVDQNEAERKKEFSIATQAELEKQEVEINRRREKVMEELQFAEPAVLEAQRGVQNIKKQHLTEMRSMSNPPAAVKLAMEAVCVLLGYEVRTWRDVQLVVRKDDFITSIIAYDSENQLTPEVSEHMDKVYFSRPDFNYDTVNRASKACGPLLQWVIAQLKYYNILEQVGPLREEVRYLEQTATKSKAQLIAIAEMIAELEDSIKSYKLQYSELIREGELIKVEIESTEKKVARSVQLIENLSRERERWIGSRKQFEQARNHMVGNSIITAASITYAGLLNQKQRNLTLKQWKDLLELSEIDYDETNTLTASLCSASDRTLWTSCGLKDDAVFFENFGIQQHSEIPYFYDPSGSIKDVWVKSNLPRKVIVSSFLNPSFKKQIEDAMRFGGSILLQNAEHYDPIIDPILRQEFIYNGGRKLVEFGNKQVDYLENFRIALYTKDNRAKISLFVSSRTVLLNFTVTSSNLESQVLDFTLSHVDSDLYAKREEIIALQSEYLIKSLEIRQNLLETLASMTGTILDSDESVEALEHLEAQSSDMETKMNSSLLVKIGVDEVRNRYADLANHCKRLYEILDVFSKRSPLYNFSFKTFIDVFQCVLKKILSGLDVGSLASTLYYQVFLRFAPVVKEFDKEVLGLALTKTFFRIEFGDHIKECLDMLLPEKDPDELSVQKAFKVCLAEYLEDWADAVEKNQTNDAFKLLRPIFESVLGYSNSTVLEAYCDLSKVVFGVPWKQIQLYGISEWIEERKVPLLLAVSDNFDPSFKVEQLAREKHTKLLTVAMGTEEGKVLAKEELKKAMVSGSWLLIQNVQLSPEGLSELESYLETSTYNELFRLLLTCLLQSTNIPEGILSMSTVVTYEVSPSFKQTLGECNLMITLNPLLGFHYHVAFLLSWFHAQVQERLKYVPLSFSQSYDVNETDLLTAAAYTENALREVTCSEQIPWNELKFFLVEIVYGGKISEPRDLNTCQNLADELLGATSFDDSFTLGRLGLLLPSSSDYESWFSKIPEVPPLAWLGLPDEALLQVKKRHSKQVAAAAKEIDN